MNVSFLLPRLRAEWRKRTRRELSAADIHPRFRDRERHFRSPPMTAEMVATISRLSPQFHLEPGESSRSFWELTQNGSCWGEFDAVEPVLRSMQAPAKTLDIGCGLGRSTAFFRRALGWEETEFHLYDGDGPRIDYPRSGERTDRSFCGDLTTLRQVLEHNEVPNFRIFDAHELNHRLDALRWTLRCRLLLLRRRLPLVPRRLLARVRGDFPLTEPSASSRSTGTSRSSRRSGIGNSASSPSSAA